MKGANKSRRVLSGSGYKIAIGVVVAIVVAVVLLLLAFLPAVEETPTVEKRIVSIEDVSGGIGVGSDPNLIYVNVTYSDGTIESVPLSSTEYEGFDLSVSGQKNVALSYGGFEQTITFDVQDIDCVVKYESALGGTIQGEVQQSIANGGTATTVVAVPETGYVFSVWNDGYPYATRKDVGVVENKTYIAIFEKAKYVVRFYYDDGTVASEEKVSFGESATKVPNKDSDPRMAKYGYEFNGWAPGEETYSAVERDLNVYPQYIKKATDVIMSVPPDIYGQSMGEVAMAEEGYYPYDEMAIIVAKPNLDRVFSHWIIKGTDGREYEVNRDTRDGNNEIVPVTVPVGLAGEKISFVSTISGSSATDYQISFTPNSSISQIYIEAVFSHASMKITFMNYQKADNGGKEAEITVKADAVINSKAIPTPQGVYGLQFEGWYKQGDKDMEILDLGVATFQQPTVLVAKWKRLRYELRFIYYTPDDAINDTPLTSVKTSYSYLYYQDTYAGATDLNGIKILGLPLENPADLDYEFVGWVDAKTHEPVDGQTKLYYNEEYGDKFNDEGYRYINIIPKWTPKLHRLYVKINGSADATISWVNTHTFLQGSAKINGEFILEQPNAYTLQINALEGNQLIRAIWKYNGNTASANEYSVTPKSAEFDIVSSTDNEITVDVAVKKVNITVTNGGDGYSGSIGFGDVMYYGDEITIPVDYNTSVDLKVVSQNALYAIAEITVDGASKGNIFDDDKLEDTVTLSNVKKDTEVKIIYRTRKYFVWLDVGSSGDLWETDIDSLDKEAEFAVGEKEYSYGEYMYLRVKAKSDGEHRNVISYIRVNGIKCDLYTNTVNGIILHNWYINGEPSGVAVQKINNELYYVYSAQNVQTLSEGAKFIYAENMLGVPVLFKEESESGRTYYREVSQTEYKAEYDALYKELDIENRSIFNTEIQRDNRITSVDLVVKVSKDFNVSVGFKEVGYQISGTGENGFVDLSATKVQYNGSAVLTARPSAGYYVRGYIENGRPEVTIENNKKGEDYTLVLEGIKEDKDIVFVFCELSNKILFEHANISAGNGEVVVNEKLLNSSASFDCGYHSTYEAQISVSEGYRISKISVKINGNPTAKEELVHHNMTSYKLILPDVTAGISVKIHTEEAAKDKMTGDTYSVEASLSNATCSVEYIEALLTGSNNVIVKADYGYKISSIYIRVKNTTTDLFTSLVASAGGKKEFSFDIPADSGLKAGDELVIAVNAEPLRYTLTTKAIGEGTISEGKDMFFGSEEPVDINASPNCHISALYINGEEVSVGLAYSGSRWPELRRDQNTGLYYFGTYAFMPEKDMNIVAVFERNSFRLTVDESTVNGRTTLSVNKNGNTPDVEGIADGAVSDRVPYGWFVTINMVADTGYHIARLYINDILTDFTFTGDNKNECVSATYVYQGGIHENRYVGATGRINVRVVYEINKYSVNYVITNVSANFENDTMCGVFSITGYESTNNSYYEVIEYGSNFAFNVSPATGYYIKEIIMYYKSAYDDKERAISRKPGDKDGMPALTANGGIVWFNRFVGQEYGVTADIPKIEVVFDRYLYSIDMLQTSAPISGKMEIAYSYSNPAVTKVVVFDQNDQKYTYDTDSGKFYEYGTTTEKELTLICDYDEERRTNRYVYVDEDNNIYTLKLEHGLRYAVTLTPATGYETLKLSVGGDDSYLSKANGGRYSENVAGNIEICAEYRILTYNINFAVTVNEASLTGIKAPYEIPTYASISIKLLSGEIYDNDYNRLSGHIDLFELPTAKAVIDLADMGYRISYGSRIQLVAKANFDTTGYKLSNFKVFGYDILPREESGEMQFVTEYAYEINSIDKDIDANCVFDITRYSVKTGMTYGKFVKNGENKEFVKEDVIESRNSIRSESRSSDLSKIAWGSASEYKISIAEGYILEEICLYRGEESPSAKSLIYSRATDYFGNRNDGIYQENVRNLQTNEIRNLLTVYNVKSKITIELKITRKEYKISYVINGQVNLDSLQTSYNANNINYPKSTTDNYISPTAYHYDELTGIITPKEGYRIMPVDGEYKVVVKAYRVNGNGEKEYLVNDANEFIQTVLPLTAIGDNGAMKFDFHPATSSLRLTNIFSDVEIAITLEIKQYILNTKVDYTESRNDNSTEGNNTQVNWEIKHVVANNTASGNMKNVNKDNTMSRLVDYFDEITYTMTTTPGYRLSQITINGKQWKDIELMGKLSSETINENTQNEKTITTRRYYFYEGDGEEGSLSPDERDKLFLYGFEVEGSYNKTSKKYNYTYTLRFVVNNSLLKGIYNQPQSALTVIIDIVPIVYDIKSYIDGQEYDYGTYDDRFGISDGKKLTLYVPKTVDYFGTINLGPRPYSGYVVKNVAIRSGTASGANNSHNYNITGGLGFGDFECFATYDVLPELNLLSAETCIHIFYETDITSYKVNTSVYVNTDDPEVQVGMDSIDKATAGGFIDFDKKDEDRNPIEVMPIVGTFGVKVKEEDQYVDYVANKLYKFGSEVTLEGTATSDYVIDDVVEIIDGTEVSVKAGIDDILNFDNDGEAFFLMYKINERGERTFKVIYKKKTTLTIFVSNPYKYTRGNSIGSIEYLSYINFEVRQNGVSLVNENAVGNNVCTEYKYTVLVGDTVSIRYIEMGDSSRYYYNDEDGKEVEKFSAAKGGQNSTYSVRSAIITEKTDLYLSNTVQARVTFTKETHGALSGAVGGSIRINDDPEPSSGYVRSTATVMGQELVIKVEPKANYVLSCMYVRQVDVDSSSKNGQLTFYREGREWLAFNTEQEFANLDSYGYKIVSKVDDNGKKTYTITMKGDMELKFEFFRVYSFDYGITLSEKGTIYGGNEYIKTKFTSNEYGRADKLQYGAILDIEVDKSKIPSDYVFMGWYLNGVNTYLNLDKLQPSSSYQKRRFLIDKSLDGLVIDGEEANGIMLVAVYQKPISVAIINELSYYSATPEHWNSWKSGAVRAQYYNYDGKKVAATETTKTINNDTEMPLTSVDYSSLFGASDWANRKVAFYGTDGYDANHVSKDYRIYSTMYNFNVLYSSITDNDLTKNTWTPSVIKLKLEGLPSSVTNLGWQYFNWQTKTFEDILYTYDDETYVDINGKPIKVTNKFDEYKFSLTYLFKTKVVDNKPVLEMPYAITDESGQKKTLILRPNLKKTMTLNIEQIAYDTEYGFDEERAAGNAVYSSGFDLVIKPKIDYSGLETSHVYSVSGDEKTAKLDYGVDVKLYYYSGEANQTGLGNVTYRFIGWQLRWRIDDGSRNPEKYRFIKFKSDTDTVDYYNFRLAFLYGDEPPVGDKIEIRAVYIAQYTQEFYSYNIAGSDANFISAKSAGQYAVYDAPDINISFADRTYNFPTMDLDMNAAAWTASTAGLKYNNVDLNSGDVDKDKTHVIRYRMDVGCEYTITSDNSHAYADVRCFEETFKTTAANERTHGKNEQTQGYDPNVDQLYKIYQKIYNRDNNYVLERTSVSFGEEGYAEETYYTSQYLSLELQYRSRAEVDFINLMYKAGITLPASMQGYINYGDKYYGFDGQMTIWDDGKISSSLLYATTLYHGNQWYLAEAYGGDGMSGKMSINGTVEIITYLANVVGGFSGYFNYAVNGFKSGKGLAAMSTPTYYYDKLGENNTTNRTEVRNKLFDPRSEGYRRYVIIDYDEQKTTQNTGDKHVYIYGGTLLFGDPTAENPYTVANVGAGYFGLPYKIYNATQLMNIGRIYNANGNSCRGNNSSEQMYFEIRDNIELQAYGDGKKNALPGSNTYAWVPICGEGNGFDGVLSGGGFTVSNLTAYSGGGAGSGAISSSSNLVTTSNNPNHPLATTSTPKAYGIFGKICGGTVGNMTITNVFVKLGSMDYVGALAGEICGSSITNITFANSSLSTKINYKSSATGVGATKTVGTLLKASAKGIGLLAGYVDGGNIKGIQIEQNKNDIYVGTDMTSNPGKAGVGLAIGYVCGNSFIRGDRYGYGIKFVGNPSYHTYINMSTNATAIPSGGLVGSLNGNINLCYMQDSFIQNANIRISNIGGSEATIGGLVGSVTNANVSECGISSAAKDSSASSDDGIVLNGATTTDANVGGIVGFVGQNGKITDIKPSLETGSENKCIEGIIRTKGKNIGIIAGKNEGGIIEKCGITPTLDPDKPDNKRKLCGARLLVDLNNSLQTKDINVGAIVGYNSGMIDECSVVGDASMNKSAYDASYTSASGAAIFVYHSGNGNGVTSVPTNTGVTNVKPVSYNGRIKVGGIAGLSAGTVFNSYIKETRLMVSIDINAGAPTGSSSASMAHHLVTAVGGIVGEMYTGNGEVTFNDGSNIGFKDLLENYNRPTVAVSEMKRVQSCYAVNTGLFVANRYYVDWYNASSAPILMAPNSISVAGIVGQVNGTLGKYGINTCYSMDNCFSTRFNAYGKANDNDGEGDYSSDYGWDKLTKGSSQVKNGLLAIRAGLQVDGGIFGIVGAEYPSTNGGGTNSERAGCNFCWCRGNYTDRVTPSKTSTYTERKKGISPSTNRGIDVSYSDASVHSSGDHCDGNIACPQTPTGCDDSEMLITGVEAYRNQKSQGDLVIQSGEDSIAVHNLHYIGRKYVCSLCEGEFDSKELDLGEITTIFGGGFVGYYNPSYRGSTDGRIYKTNPSNGKLVVMTDHLKIPDSAGSYWYLGSTRMYPSEAEAENYPGAAAKSYIGFINNYTELSKYLVGGQPKDPII